MQPEDFLGDSMIWFMIAALANPFNETIDFKINRNMLFKTEIECVNYLETNKQFVTQGLELTFPELNLLEIRCIDNKTAQEMREQMRSSK